MKHSDSWKGIVLMLLCSVCLCTSQFIWKRWDGMVPLILGFGFNGLGALAMIFAYRFGSLSVLQPINSVSYVISTALGVICFHESVTSLRLAGITCIIIGVLVLTREHSCNP